MERPWQILFEINKPVVNVKDETGPISEYLSMKEYMEERCLPEVMESLLAALMMECPDDAISYLAEKVDQLSEMDIENVDWRTFIQDLHPDKDPIHLSVINDEEWREAQKGTIESGKYYDDEYFTPDSLRLTPTPYSYNPKKKPKCRHHHHHHL